MGTFHTRCTEYYLTISLYQHVYNVCVPGASTLVDAVCNWRLRRLQPSGDFNAGEPPRCLISGPAARRPGHLDQPAGPAHRRTGPCAEVVLHDQHLADGHRWAVRVHRISCMPQVFLPVTWSHCSASPHPGGRLLLLLHPWHVETDCKSNSSWLQCSPKSGL
jgi:hypothetical protein